LFVEYRSLLIIIRLVFVSMFDNRLMFQHVNHHLHNSIQFDPAPKRGELVITRRAPDFF